MGSTYNNDLQLEIARKIFFVLDVNVFSTISVENSKLLDNRFWRTRFIKDFGLYLPIGEDYELMYTFFRWSIKTKVYIDHIDILGFMLIDLLVRYRTISVAELTHYIGYNNFLYSYWASENSWADDITIGGYYEGINSLALVLLVYKKGLVHTKESIDSILGAIDTFCYYRHVNKLSYEFGVYTNRLKQLLTYIIAILDLDAIEVFNGRFMDIGNLLGMI